MRFVTIGRVGDVGEGMLASFELGGVQVAVANVSGTFYGFSNLCTHGGCELADGELEGTAVTCPCHFGQFDVTTGAARRAPAAEPLAVFTVRVEGDSLLVDIGGETV